MKRMFTNTALFLVLAAGSTAIAQEPDHKTAMADKAKDVQPTLEDFVGKAKLPELFIGSKAPELQIAKYIKGDSVDGFEKDQVYVVEFWATWCGPCIAAFPHLSELQAEHGEKVQFIGVNVWEGVEDQAERIEKVEGFVADQGDRMSYTVAVENGSMMADNWMKPAAQNGIPAAFIVDGTGHVAWIGHPSSIDEPLADIVAGNFDPSTAVQDAKDEMLLMSAFTMFRESVQTGKNLSDARQIANIMIDQHFTEQPSGLNAIAWMLLTSESENIGKEDYKVAHRAIAIACEKTKWEDWSLLDTYALAAFKTGNKAEAIKWQKKAIKLTPANNDAAKKDLEGRLAEYSAAD
ncbi:MAG: TlpA disulfide reductase family protein [Phycisphaerales bacterium]|nr:TlpA disulfide reductase family protein [Phycisphaerales bacterium]